MAVAGKVAITLSTENGGAWSADVTYDRLVAVKHNNNLYISRKTVANVEPPNDEFWFLALEGFSGEDIEKIISGETVVGNANLLEGLTAEEVSASGARNLIPYPYYETTHTESGITWTDNGNGTVTANGIATAHSYFTFLSKSMEFVDKLMNGETYTLNDGVEDSTCYIWISPFTESNTEITRYRANNGSVSFVVDKSTWHSVTITAYIPRGTTVENLTFRPMLELGSVAHDFVPYHFGGAEKAKEAENALTLDGHEAEYFAPKTDLANYLPLSAKPTGSYTGNGDATARTINVGVGVGVPALLIVAWERIVIAYIYGAVGFNVGTKTTEYFTYDKVKYDHTTGILTLATDSDMVNLSNETFTYGRL